MIGDYKPSLVQITNIASSVQNEQIKSLFTYIGKIDNFVMYPLDSLSQCSTRICFIKFADDKLIDACLHLNNTVFIDRAIIVLPSIFSEIPQESVALQYLTPSEAVSSMLPVKNNWPPYIANQIVGVGGEQKVDTWDPLLHVQSLPHYPQLNAVDIDAYKIDDLRRTVYASNMPQATTAAQVTAYFDKIGDVQYVRMARNIHTPGVAYAFVEFYDQRSVPSALSLSGTDFQDQPISIAHAFRPILKNSVNGANSKELEDAMKKVNEAQALISAAVNVEKDVSKRSRSKERSKRSRSRGKRSVSPRNTHSRARRSRSRGHRSRSRGRKSRSRGRKSRSRGRRSRSRNRRSRSRRSRTRDRRSRSRARRHSPYRSRARRSSPHRSSRRRTRSRSSRRSKRSRSRVRKRSRSSHRRTSRRQSRSSSVNRQSSKRGTSATKSRKSRSASPRKHSSKKTKKRDDSSSEGKRDTRETSKSRSTRRSDSEERNHSRKRSRSVSSKRSSRRSKKSPRKSRKSRERKEKRNSSRSTSRDTKKHKKKSRKSTSPESAVKPTKRNYDSEEDSKEVIDLESNSDIVESTENPTKKNSEIDLYNV